MFAKKRWMMIVSAAIAAGFSVPQPMPAAEGPTLSASPIAAGTSHSLAVASDGAVWGWGASFAWGALGWKETADPWPPGKAQGAGDVVAAAGGYDYSVALKGDGTLWVLNDPSCHQPSEFTGFVAVAAGMNEILALKRDGTVWQGWCQVRQVSGLSDAVAIAGGWNQVCFAPGGDYFLALKADGTVWEWVDQDPPTQVSGLGNVVAIAAGIQSHTFSMYLRAPALAVKGDGTVWAWVGGSPPVQVSGLSGVVGVAAGGEYRLALKGDGTVWAWGRNEVGQLGDGTTADRLLPVQVAGLTGVIRIAASTGHSLALKEDGTLWAWGRNGDRQLGDGTTTTRLTPVQVSGLPPLLMAPAVSSVVNAANFGAGPIAPGEIVSVFGRQIGPTTAVSNVPTAAGVFEGTLAQSRVLFDGIAAPMLFSGASQVNAIVPYALAGKKSTQVQVEYRGVKSSPVSLDLAASAPGVFSLNSTGAGQGIVLNEDGSLNSGSNPARSGSVVTLFATGEGQTSPPGVDGRVAAVPLPQPLLPVTVQIGGQQAQVLEVASAPGLAGVLQVKARIPEAAAPGPALPVTLMIGAAGSQAGVTLAVR